MNLKLKLIGGSENIIEQPIGKIPVFKIKCMEGDDNMEGCIGIYCYHYLLILQIIPVIRYVV